MWRVACVLMLAVSCNAYGQQATPTPSDIIAKQREQMDSLAAAWLQSGDARVRAWGAYLAARDRLKERIPDLLSLVQSYEVVGSAATLSEMDAHDAMLAVLDAVVQLRADVPVDTAAKLYPEFRAQSTILLARAKGDATEPLLRIFQTEQDFDGEWLAVGNLLVERRAAGFAAAVLSGMTVHASVTVSDGGGGFGSGSSHCGGGGYQPAARAEWPEIGTYSMAACASEDGAVLVPGTHPSYYSRGVNAHYLAETDYRCLENGGRDGVRADYLATLLWSERGARPLPSEVSHSIVWTSAEGYLSELRGFIGEQQNLYRQIAERLRSNRLLSEAEAESSRPRLEISVVDVRGTKTVAPPTLAEVGDRVTVAFR